MKNVTEIITLFKYAMQNGGIIQFLYFRCVAFLTFIAYYFVNVT